MSATDSVKNIKKYVNRVCCAVLVFIGILLTFQLVYVYLPWYIISDSADTVIQSLIYALSYFFAAFIFRKTCKKDALPIRFAPNFEEHTFPLFFAALGVLISISHIQCVFGSVTDAAEVEAYHGSEIIAFVISSVIVPAFCEELFFRGIVLTNLLPLGRGFAIIASGVIFGLAHGNHDQILFASLSGIVLGWFYVRTDSIWSGIVLHMMNNLLAVVQTVIIGLLPFEKSYIICVFIELTLLLLGSVSLVYLLHLRKNGKSDETCGGSFGRLLPSFRTAETHADVTEYLRGFFSPVMIIFLCYVIFNEVIYVIYA